MDSTEFPFFKDANPIVCFQEEGETIFVPSNWFHQVENVTDCLSINHNWGNACNLLSLWELLLSDYKEVERGIMDIKDTFTDEEEWFLKCQKILLVNSGMDFFLFFDFISFISSFLLDEYSHHSPLLKSADILKLNKRALLIIFNLHRIHKVLGEMKNQLSIQKLMLFNKLPHLHSLLSTLQNFLKSISDLLQVPLNL